MLENNINYIPASNKNLHEWRNPFKGIRYHHKDKFLLNGSIDDVWTNNTTKKIIV